VVDKPNDPSGMPFDEDEDLFDFPIIEMTLEGLQERATASSEVRTLPPDPGPPPALPKQSQMPAQASTMGSTPPVASNPAPAPAPIPDMRPKPVTVAAPLAAVAHQEAIDEEPVASDSIARRVRRVGVRIAVALLIVVNAGGFWFLWRTHTRFGSGLDELRAEIDTASKRLERARRDVNDRVPSASFDSTGGLEGIDALERTALQIATDEIRTGDYGSARKRLSRLLARAERMSPGLRAEVEPRAAYLIAQSYHEEARARSGVKPASEKASAQAPAGDKAVGDKAESGAPLGDKH
jgi:hypothetical protein